MKTQQVIIGSDDGCGHVTLNRPKAINALNFEMCRTIIAALQSWEFDPEIAAIIIDHSDGRGFCAGGDLRALYENIRDGSSEVLDFFRTEYRLDHLLFTLAKPSVCFMDGIVMGGGAGIAMPCRYRVATEATIFAMPETGIGLYPDVGAGWFLSRLPDRIGQWLALTGARLDGADCLRLGLATHYLPRDELASVKARTPSLKSGLRASREETRYSSRMISKNWVSFAHSARARRATLQQRGDFLRISANCSLAHGEGSALNTAKMSSIRSAANSMLVSA